MLDQGKEYAEFISSELALEYERRASLGASGLAIVTSSSALVALIVALSAVVLGKDSSVSANSARGVLVSLALFVGAGVLGLVATRSREYKVANTDTLEAMLTYRWKDHATDARNVVSHVRLGTIASLRQGNNAKATVLLWSLGMQLVAVLALAVALALELAALR